jgi:DNA (cytosine-5)-methyltransferase 1
VESSNAQRVFGVENVIVWMVFALIVLITCIKSIVINALGKNARYGLHWRGCDLNGLALCAGYGGLELGIERVFPSIRTVCYVEGEAYAASHLVKKMEEGRLHNAPIWNDLRTFDGKPWRGKVDLIAGGFPCQPFSSAGKQLGDEDPRHLWPFIKRIIGEVRPGFLFFENVPGVVKWILPSILLDLAELGYNASWGVVAASEVGAPHRRKRWFLFATLCDSDSYGFGKYQDEEIGERINQKRQLERDRLENLRSIDTDSIHSRECVNKGAIRQEHRDDLGRLCSNVSDTNGERSTKSRELFKGSNGIFINCTCETRQIIPNTDSPGIKRSRGINGKAQKIRKGKRNIDQKDKWGGRFESWWEVEPGMGRLVDGATDWVDKLRILGNGVVPQQAAHSLQILGGRLAWGIVAKREPKG